MPRIETSRLFYPRDEYEIIEFSSITSLEVIDMCRMAHKRAEFLGSRETLFFGVIERIHKTTIR
jgi:hypothetical protein